jgi:hypothetical protein
MLLIRMCSQSYNHLPAGLRVELAPPLLLENGSQIRISLSLTISIAKPCTRSMTKLLQFIRSGKVQFEETYVPV